jgi:hypothetical protein
MLHDVMIEVSFPRVEIVSCTLNYYYYLKLAKILVLNYLFRQLNTKFFLVPD